VHFILIKLVLSNHHSYVTLFQCAPGRSNKTALTVAYLFESKQYFIYTMYIHNKITIIGNSWLFTFRYSPLICWWTDREILISMGHFKIFWL